MCVCVCVCVCECLLMCIGACACVWLCFMCGEVLVCECARACMRACVRARVCVCVRACVRACVRVCVCVCVCVCSEQTIKDTQFNSFCALCFAPKTSSPDEARQIRCHSHHRLIQTHER